MKLKWIINKNEGNNIYSYEIKGYIRKFSWEQKKLKNLSQSILKCYIGFTIIMVLYLYQKFMINRKEIRGLCID